jgi:hypothetical protein
MSQPPDDPYYNYNSQTDNSPWPPQGQGPGSNYPQQPSAPNYPPAYPPTQGLGNQPGFTPQGFPPNQGSANQPGFMPQGFPQQGSSPGYPGQPPAWQGGFAPAQAPGSYPGQLQPGYPPPQDQGQFGALPPWPNPAPPPKKSSNGLAIASIIIVVLLIVGGVSAFLLFRGKSNPTASTTPTAAVNSTTTTNGVTPVVTQPSSNITPSTGSTGTVVQPIQAGTTWIVTLARVDETTSGNVPAEPGKTYLEFTLSLHNVSATTVAVSSLLEFSLVDSSGTKYDELDAVGQANINQTVDGNVAAGQTLNGQLPYKVSQSTHSFVLTFEYGLISGSTAAISWPIHV